jgi:hypothetical protein
MYSSRRLANLTKERAQFSWITSKRNIKSGKICAWHAWMSLLHQTSIIYTSKKNINNLYCYLCEKEKCFKIVLLLVLRSFFSWVHW